MAQDNQVITSQVKVTSGTKALVTGGTYTCSTGDNGGAVNVAQGCTVTGATVSFVNNTLTKSSKSGGAIYNNKGEVALTGGATFSGNIATSYGGAIYSYGYNKTPATLTIEGDVTFTGNTGSNGGAIYSKALSTLTITGNATFTGNTGSNGGAISTYGVSSGTPTLTIDGNATFTNNTATEHKGGAINSVISTLTITGDVTFTGNSTKDGGGGAIATESSTLTIHGGAIFENNVALTGGTGGAINNAVKSTLTIYGDVTFTGNTANNPRGSVGGGAINNTGSSTLTIYGCATFTNNIASGYNIYEEPTAYGGAISNTGSSTLTLTGGATFTGNTANRRGGAIYNDAIINFTDAITLATETDTWVNAGTSSSNLATVNWNLTGGTSTACINNFQRYSCSNTRQTITVAAEQALGEYVIATGDLSDLTGKNTFYITIDGKSLSDALTVGTLGYFYSNRYYSLTKADDKMTLSVSETGAVTKPTGLGAQNTTIKGGTYNRIMLGGELQQGNHDFEGGYAITIQNGEFASDFAGGDAADGYVVRTGSITVNVSGGNFAKSFAAGSYYATEGSVLGTAAIGGTLSLNITGGTIAGRVYGGNGAMTDQLGTCTALQGDTYLTINASSAIAFGECIVAGSRGHGVINGSTNVTVKGSGTNLTFADDSVLFGGCSGDYYKTEGGVRTASTSVTGKRNLTFSAFTGDFNAEIRMFSNISFANNTNLNFADANLDLKEVGTWNFDCTSCATNLTRNKFTGDTINVDTTGLSLSWTLLSGDAAAFADLGSAKSVTLGGVEATYNDGVWSNESFSLALNDQKTSLIISANPA